MSFVFQELSLSGAFLINSFHIGDLRGGFTKYYEKEKFDGAGIQFNPTESFVSRSKKDVIRGLHFQLRNPQAKLVFVVSGKAWDVIVDLRVNSPTFKQWQAKELSAENHMGFYIPAGFAHGFASLEDDTMMFYQCEGKYDKETDSGIRFDDPELNIRWPISEKVAIHSERDMHLLSLQDYLQNSMKKEEGII